MRHTITALALAAALAACGRDMLISNGRLVNAMNAGGNMITNLPPEFWEGHGGGGGANTNAVNDLIRTYDTTNLTARIAAKQDKLPYATNAIPAGVIADAPWLPMENPEGHSKSISWVDDELYLLGCLNPTDITITDFSHISRFQGGLRTLEMDLNDKVSEEEAGTIAANRIVNAVAGWALKWQPKPTHTNDVNGLIAKYDQTNLTGRINAKVGQDELEAATNAIAKVGQAELAAATNAIARITDGTHEIKADGSFATATVSDTWSITGLPEPENPDAETVWYYGFGWINEQEWDAFKYHWNVVERSWMPVGREPMVGDYMNHDAVYLEFPNGVPTTKIRATYDKLATTNGVNAAIAASLSGRTYDFDHGSNFTKRVYVALTNVIQALGGTVANPPTF